MRLNLVMENYLGVCEWVQGKLEGLYKKEAGQRGGSQGRDDVSRGQGEVQKGAEAKAGGRLSEAEKGECLRRLGLQYQSATDQRIQTTDTDSSRSWRPAVCDQLPAWSGSGQSPPVGCRWQTSSCVHPSPPMAEKVRELEGVPFIWALISS